MAYVTYSIYNIVFIINVTSIDQGSLTTSQALSAPERSSASLSLAQVAAAAPVTTAVQSVFTPVDVIEPKATQAMTGENEVEDPSTVTLGHFNTHAAAAAATFYLARGTIVRRQPNFTKNTNRVLDALDVDVSKVNKRQRISSKK